MKVEFISSVMSPLHVNIFLFYSISIEGVQCNVEVNHKFLS